MLCLSAVFSKKLTWSFKNLKTVKVFFFIFKRKPKSWINKMVVKNSMKRCMICSKDSNDVTKYKCNAYTCDKCVDMLIAKKIITYECNKCGARHRLKRSDDVPRVMPKKRKTRARWVMMGEKPRNKPNSTIRNEKYEKVGLSLRKCTDEENGHYILEVSL